MNYIYFTLFLIFVSDTSSSFTSFLSNSVSGVSFGSSSSNIFKFFTKYQTPPSKRTPMATKMAAIVFNEYLKWAKNCSITLLHLFRRNLNAYRSISPSYSQQLPVPWHVFLHTRQDLSSKIPKNIGLGMKANNAMNIRPKPIATGLSFSSTHLQNRKEFFLEWISLWKIFARAWYSPYAD